MYPHRQDYHFIFRYQCFHGFFSGCGLYFEIKNHCSAIFTVFGHTTIELLRH